MIIDKGVVLPNAVRWTPAIPVVKDLGVTVAEVLIYDNVQDQIPDLLALQAAIPGLRITARMYAENIITFDPVIWMKECIRRLRVLLDAGIGITGIIICNEPNIEAPDNLKADWNRQARWHLDAVVEWYSRIHEDVTPGVLLYMTALAPTGLWRDGLMAYRAHGLQHWYDIASAHCYPGSEDSWKAVNLAFPTLPISITEWNNLDPQGFISSLDSTIVKEVFYFILSSPDPQFNFCTLIGSPYYDKYKNVNMQGGSVQPMSTAHDLFDAYYKSVSGTGFNPDTGLGQYISNNKDIVFGLPVTGELPFNLNGDDIIWRGYTNGILLYKDGVCVWKPNVREADLENPFA